MKKYFCVAMFLLALTDLVGQNRAPKRDTVDVTGGLLLPSPGEVISSINSLGNDMQWSDVMEYDDYTFYQTKYTQSLNLGVRAADAFVTIYDRDLVNFGKMNEVIFKLSRELRINGLGDYDNSLIRELASKEKWDELTIELNSIHKKIMDEVESKANDDILLLTSLGGYLEGLRISSELLSLDYSSDKTNILSQTRLMAFYLDSLDEFSDQLISDLYLGLQKIQLVKPDQNGKYSKDQVVRINSIAKSLVSQIVKSK